MAYAKKVLKLHLKVISQDCCSHIRHCRIWGTDLLFDIYIYMTLPNLQRMQENGQLIANAKQGLANMESPQGKKTMAGLSHSV